MSTITVTRLGDLLPGDLIHRIGDHTVYTTPKAVTHALAPLEPGSPVSGVRLANPHSRIEHVLYAAQVDGDDIVITPRNR